MHPHLGMFPCRPSSGPIPCARRNRMVAPMAPLLRWPHGAGRGAARRQGRPGQRRCLRHRPRHRGPAGRSRRRGGGGRRIRSRARRRWPRKCKRAGGSGHRPALRRPPRGVGHRLRRARRHRVRDASTRSTTTQPGAIRVSTPTPSAWTSASGSVPSRSPPGAPSCWRAMPSRSWPRAAGGQSSPSRRARAPSASRPGWPTACPRPR